MPFLKKSFGKIWLSYDQKQNVRVATLFWKVFKNVFVGGPKVILYPQSFLMYFFKIEMVNLKQVFGHGKFLPINGILYHNNFGWLGHFFCTKWLNTKTEIKQPSKIVKHLGLAQQKLCFVVGTSGTCLGTTCVTWQPCTG